MEQKPLVGCQPLSQPVLRICQQNACSIAAKAYELEHSVGRSSPLFSVMRRAMRVMDGTTE